LIVTLAVLTTAQRRNDKASQSFDVIIKGGTIYDGTGGPPVKADVGIKSDRIAFIGNLSKATAPNIVDANGLAVSPGFINMLAHSETAWLMDSRSLSELKQGVTTQIFGELSMGPLNQEMKQRLRDSQGDVKFDGYWTTLSEYLCFLE
jgi:N-acyl-D-amino-acid deacylase